MAIHLFYGGLCLNMNILLPYINQRGQNNLPFKVCHKLFASR